MFLYTVLTAIHDDWSHTAEGQTNWLACLQGHGTVFRLRMRMAEYLGIRLGPGCQALVNAMAVWRTMPPVFPGGLSQGAINIERPIRIKLALRKFQWDP